MDYKKIRKGISRYFAWCGLRLCSLIIRVMPQKWLYSFAKGISSFGFFIVAKQRKIALETLDIAFGSAKTDAEKEHIARDCFTFLAKGAVELLFLMDKPRLLKERVQLFGKEYIDRALAQGKGVILVSAHFGNFPLMLSRLALEGYNIAGIMRPMRDSRVERFFLNKRIRLNVKTVYAQPRKACVEESIRVLRNNALLFIPIDQHFGTGGVFVDFFGKKAATATGPVVLARRTQAKLIPCFILRQRDDTHKIIFEPSLELKDAETDEKTTLINIQRLTDIIESYIRRYPAEWGWMHRRWKTKPS
ncbi:MAG: lysophospholipid acyltransferase family protein [Candidatus Omnitrophota bacterium]